MTAPVPVVDGIFTFHDDGSARLLAGRCRSCDRHAFPRPEACPYCGQIDVEEAELGRSGGTLWAWTAITAAPPGYTGPVPYGFGVVQLDEGLRVVTHLTQSDPGRISFGDRVRCVVAPLHEDEQGHQVVTWAFAPEVPA